MKIIILLACLFRANLASAIVLSSLDSDKKCTLYRVPNEESPILEDEVVITDKDAYGITFQDLEIDFNKKEVSVTTMINIVLGANKPLINGRSIIKEKNPNFKFLINQLNRKFYVFEKICINSKNEIIYASQFEATK